MSARSRRGSKGSGSGPDVTRSRVLKRALLAIAVGTVINAGLAQCLGWWPTAGVWSPAPIVYVPVGDEVGEVHLSADNGRLTITWRVMEPWAAATWQRIRTDREGPDKVTPVLDPVTSVPAWCSVWDADMRTVAKSARESASSIRPLIRGPRDVGIGWPCTSFSVTLEPRILGAVPASDPPPVFRGGFMSDLTRGWGPVRVVAWRPVFPGLLYGSLFWAVMVSPLIFAPAAVKARLRRRRGQCAVCGYDRRGLAPAALCPECGAPSSKAP
jgi:hypothetical protein